MLTDLQKELLNHLMEECAEVIQACSKIQRFDLDTPHPSLRPMTNKEHLNAELHDVMVLLDKLTDEGIL